MPGRDGTGPMGQGSRTGRGMGNCRTNINNTPLGCGMGRGRRMGMNNVGPGRIGRGRGFGRNFNVPQQG
jgi:hypothetical protein